MQSAHTSNDYKPESWKIWFGCFSFCASPHNTKKSGVSKAIEYVCQGDIRDSLIDLCFVDGKPSLSSNQFIKILKEITSLNEHVLVSIKDVIDVGGFEGLKNKKF